MTNHFDFLVTFPRAGLAIQSSPSLESILVPLKVKESADEPKNEMMLLTKMMTANKAASVDCYC